MDKNSTNKRTIALNTLFLYFRTLISIIVGLYSSRILLKELGVDDYGLYYLVGSIVTMFASVRSVLATATQRFLNFENKSESSIINKAAIFQTSIIIHWVLCLLFFLIVECIGLYIILNSNIPNNQYFQAEVLLHISIFTALISITTIPYDAVIVSNEKFNIYAFFAIIESLLKLLAALCMVFIDYNKVIWYAIFILLSSFCIRFINMIYCKKNFKECKIRVKYKKTIARDLCKFAGWNFLGNTAYTICNECINFILNIFGGVVANAARAICYQVLNAITEICGKLVTASAPQSIRIYADGNYFEFNQIICFCTKMVVYLYFFMAIPLILLTRPILQLWLGEIPEYGIVFVQIITIFGFLRVIHFSLDLVFKASGKLAKYQMIELICLLGSIPLAYTFLKLGFPLYYCFIAMIITNILNTIFIVWLAKYHNLNIKIFLREAILPIICIGTIIVVSYFLLENIENQYLKVVLMEFLFIILLICWGISKQERQTLFFYLSKNKSK